MAYTTADLSPSIAVQLELTKLTRKQLAEIVDASEVLARHSAFDTDTHVRCQECARDNRCASYHNAIAVYDGYRLMPQRQPRRRQSVDEIGLAGGERQWLVE